MDAQFLPYEPPASSSHYHSERCQSLPTDTQKVNDTENENIFPASVYY